MSNNVIHPNDRKPLRVIEGNVYLHERTKNRYRVVVVSRDVKTKQELVTYRNIITQETWTRTLSEFKTEGKFKPL
jgi:hypothetical protein